MSVSREREAGEALSAVDARGLRRTLLHWLTVVVVLVTVFSSVVNWVFVDREPQDPVATWLGGLENGRSRQLLSRTEAVVADPTLNIFSNRVYRNAAGRIGGYEILGVDRRGSRAEIRARVWWDGPDGARDREEVHVYGVHQVRRSGPFNDQWQLDSPDAAPFSIHLPAPLDELSVNGETVRPDPDDRVPDPEGPGGTWRFEALPGNYAIGLPGNSYYTADPPLEPHTVAFRDPAPASVALRIEPSPRMWQESTTGSRNGWRAAPTPTSCPPRTAPRPGAGRPRRSRSSRPRRRPGRRTRRSPASGGGWSPGPPWSWSRTRRTRCAGRRTRTGPRRRG